MSPGDRIVAMNGHQLLSVGEITGEYEYDPSDVQPHHRSVSWHDVPAESWPDFAGIQTTIYDFTRRYGDAVRVEKLLLSTKYNPPPVLPVALVREAPAPPLTTYTTVLKPVPLTVLTPLTPLEQRIKDILDRKGQVILYGPPGTGKTYSARQTARGLQPGKYAVDGHGP